MPEYVTRAEATLTARARSAKRACSLGQTPVAGPCWYGQDETSGS
jgi:hypothetical protein